MPAELAQIAAAHGLAEWSTDLDAALADPSFSVFFDAAATHQRRQALDKAIAAGKHIYTEKPVALSGADGRALLAAARARGLKHAAVEDKQYLPGLQKLAALARAGFFGRVVGFRLEFGWWVFDGAERPSQRPSWNYTRAGGGGLILDMYPHWRYVIENILGPHPPRRHRGRHRDPATHRRERRALQRRCRGHRHDPGRDGRRRDRHHHRARGRRGCGATI